MSARRSGPVSLTYCGDVVDLFAEFEIDEGLRLTHVRDGPNATVDHLEQVIVVLAHDFGEDVVAAGGDDEVVDLAHRGHLLGHCFDVALDANPDHGCAREPHLHGVGDRHDLHDAGLDESLDPLTYGCFGEPDGLADGGVRPTPVFLQLLDDGFADVVEPDDDSAFTSDHGLDCPGRSGQLASDFVELGL